MLIAGIGVEVDGNQQGFVVAATQECVLAVGVERTVLIVDIHKVEESSARYGFLLVADGKYRAVFVA